MIGPSRLMLRTKGENYRARPDPNLQRPRMQQEPPPMTATATNWIRKHARMQALRAEAKSAGDIGPKSNLEARATDCHCRWNPRSGLNWHGAASTSLPREERASRRKPKHRLWSDPTRSTHRRPNSNHKRKCNGLDHSKSVGAGTLRAPKFPQVYKCVGGCDWDLQ